MAGTLAYRIGAVTSVTSGRSGTFRTADQSASGGIRRRTSEKEPHVKRITLIASALCFSLGAFSSFAEDKMEKTDKMEKPDRMEKADKMDKMGRHDKKHDKMDKMEKPGAMQ